MKIYKMAIITMMALISQVTYGQVTVDDNVPVFGRWVGFNNNSGIPLPIENRGFDEIDTLLRWVCNPAELTSQIDLHQISLLYNAQILHQFLYALSRRDKA